MGVVSWMGLGLAGNLDQLPPPGLHISPVQHSGGVWFGGSCELLSGALHMDRKAPVWERGLGPWGDAAAGDSSPQVCPRMLWLLPWFWGSTAGFEGRFLCFHYEQMVLTVGRKPCTVLMVG